jgi:hypothetical protein
MANSRLYTRCTTLVFLLVLASLVGHFLVEAIFAESEATAIVCCGVTKRDGNTLPSVAAETTTSTIHVGYTLPLLHSITCCFIFAFILTNAHRSLRLPAFPPPLLPPNSFSTIS